MAPTYTKEAIIEAMNARNISTTNVTTPMVVVKSTLAAWSDPTISPLNKTIFAIGLFITILCVLINIAGVAYLVCILFRWVREWWYPDRPAVPSDYDGYTEEDFYRNGQKFCDTFFTHGEEDDDDDVGEKKACLKANGGGGNVEEKHYAFRGDALLDDIPTEEEDTRVPPSLKLKRGLKLKPGLNVNTTQGLKEKLRKGKVTWVYLPEREGGKWARFWGGDDDEGMKFAVCPSGRPFEGVCGGIEG
ncbi:MAG: hypothetical protein Q9222_007843 [Ikaeria aurantiellina]